MDITYLELFFDLEAKQNILVLVFIILLFV